MTTAFEEFFEKKWPNLLSSVPDRKDVFSNGESLRAASWDRKAAYLVWCASQSDAFTYAKGDPAELATAPRCSMCGEKQFDTPSGMTCINGHGGVAPAEEPDPFDLL